MKKQRIVFLITSVLVVLLGVASSIASMMLFDLRHSEALSLIGPKSTIGLASLSIMILEWGSALIGTTLTLLGGTGIFINVKKMR